mmetsp:Transcript_19386/g.18732  ORF Transcript_19386/g.18732 Transcript_19386/m.18732 type:complete len:737 (-) Transcript_19386:324-2534(-)
MIHRIFSITALILLLHTSNSYRAIPSQKNSGKAYTSQTINKFSYNAVEHNRYKSILIEKGRSFELYTSWFDDDLPNILGINPFEAAILFGALYKFYGSAVLYDFAREAGKLFNTYAPIVRDLSLDIFNEGKDYLEEDRDRELLKKGGVDVENMPRKTTNIIERFQEGMKAQEEAGQGGADDDDSDNSTVEKSIAAVSASRQAERQAAAEAAAENLKDKKKSKKLALAGGAEMSAMDLSIETSEGGRTKRKSKKEVLISKNIDIDKVIQGSKNKQTYEENQLAKNLQDMSLRFEEFQAAAEAKAQQVRNEEKAGGVPPNRQLNAAPQSNYFDSDQGYDDMTQFAKMTAANGGGPVTGLGSQMSAALADSNTFSSTGQDDGYTFPSDYPSDRDGEIGMSPYGEGSGIMAAAGVAAGAGGVDTSKMSKFQMQMSGQWNQQVLQNTPSGGTGIDDIPRPQVEQDDELRIEDDSQEKAIEPNTYQDNGVGQGGFPGGGDFDYAEYGDMTDSFAPRSDRNDENRNTGRVRGRGEGRMQNTNRYQSNNENDNRYGSSSDDLPDVPPEWLSVSSDTDSPVMAADIPSDLSADDVATVIPFAHDVLVPSVKSENNVTTVDPTATVDAAAAAAALTVEVLKQLDNDYMALRTKLIGLIESQGEVKVPGTALGEVQGSELEEQIPIHTSDNITKNNHNDKNVSNHKGVDGNDHTGDAVGVDKLTEAGESPPPRTQYWPKKTVTSESV